MKTRIITGLVLAVGMLCASFFSGVLKPTRHLALERPAITLDAAIPRTVGEWRLDESILPVIPSPDVVRQLEEIYSQTLARTYINQSGERVMLSIAYGGNQGDSLQLHKPEVCYASQGFHVSGLEDASINIDARLLPVRHVVGELGNRVEPITYWVVIGNQVPKVEDRKYIQLKYGLRGVVPDGMLVRISSISPDRNKAYQLHEKFASDLKAALSSETAVRFFGEGTTGK